MRVRLHEQLLRRRRLLQHRLHRGVQDLRGGRLRRAPARSSSPGTKPRDQSRVRGRRRLDLRLRRHVRRRGRLPPPRRRHDLQGGHVRRRRPSSARARLRRHRPLQAGPHDDLRALLVRPDEGRLLRGVHADEPVRERPAVRGRQLRREDEGRELHEGRRLRLGVLRRRRVLQRRLRRRLRLVRAAGPQGHVLAHRSRRRRSARPVRRPGRGRAAATTRHLRRLRRLREVRGRDRLHRGLVHGHAAQHAGHVRRHGHVPPAGRAELLAVPVHGDRLHARRARPTADCETRPRLRQRPVRQGEPRRDVRGRRRVPLGHLRRGRVLRRRLHGRVPQLRAALDDGPLHAARRGRRRLEGRLRRPGRDDLRDERTLRRQRRLPEVQGRARCARPRAARATSTRRASTCSATGQCAPPDSLPCAPYVCNGNTCFNACTTDSNCVPPNVCNGNSCGKKMRGASCSARASASRTFCAQGVCCDTACAGACTLVRAHGHARHLHERPDGRARSGGHLRRQGRRELRHERQVPGGRLPEVRAAARPCKARPARRHDDLHARLDLRRPGRVRDAGGELVLPVPVRRRRLQGGLHGRRRLRGARRVHERLVRPQGPRQDVRRRHRVPLDVLRAGRVLRLGVRRHVPVVRAVGIARPLRQHRRRRRRSARPLRRPGRRRAAAPTARATARARAALYAAGTAVRDGLVPGERVDAHARCARATARAPASPRRRCRARPTCATASRRARPPAPSTPTASRPTSAIRRRTCAATSAASARRARRRRDCLTGDFCVDGVCCAHLVVRPAVRRARRARARTSARASPEPHARLRREPAVRQHGQLQRRRRLRAGERRRRAAARPRARSRPSRPSRTARARARARRPTTSSCSPYVCGAGACKTACATRRRLRRALHLPGRAARRQLRAQGQRPRLRDRAASASAATASTASAAARRAARACQACNVSGTGACAPLAAGTPAPDDVLHRPGRRDLRHERQVRRRGRLPEVRRRHGLLERDLPRERRDAHSSRRVHRAARAPCRRWRCAPYFCNGAAACHATCAGDGDCATGYYCAAAACAPQGHRRRRLRGANQCGTGALRRRRLLRQRRAARARPATSRAAARPTTGSPA